ncbi:MAG: phosphatidate cytidylyltransferase [Ferruginibacter sp.]
MALNIQTFKTRALTALLFVVVMLIGLLWNSWSFLILFTVVHFGCWFEYLKLVEKIYNTKIDIVGKWFFAICGFTMMIVFGIQNISYDIGKEIGGYQVSFKLLFWLLLLICLIVFLVQNKQIPVKAKWMSFAGLAYISLSFAALLYLYYLPAFNIYDTYIIIAEGRIPILIIFSIWINDTMAYLVGSFIGKTPLSKISPKKTIEGTLGGIILCITAIGTLVYFLYDIKMLTILSMIIAAICAIFGTLGDLLESKLKRMADVKDSGSFMPGHGGFLDRFDSLLVAVPAVWVFVYFFIK